MLTSVSDAILDLSMQITDIHDHGCLENILQARGDMDVILEISVRQVAFDVSLYVEC